MDHARFHHLGIAARDAAVTTDFYVRLLDGRAERMHGHTLVVAGELRIAVVPRREDDPIGHAWGHHLAIRVSAEAREAILARARALGTPHEVVRASVYLRDPDGFTLELLADG